MTDAPASAPPMPRAGGDAPPPPPPPVEPAGPRRPGQPRGHGISGRWWFAAAAVVAAAIGVIAFVAYGHLGPTGTSAKKMDAWVAGAGLGQNLGSIHDDGVHLQMVLDKHNGTNAVHTVCGVMAVDAQTGNNNLPSPDTRVTQLLARGYSKEYDAAVLCYDAGADNAALLAKSARSRAAADRLFVAALARIAEISGKTVPTTTTTTPTSGGIFG